MKNSKKIYNYIAYFIFVLALIVRLIYITKTEYFVNQHDVEPDGNGLSYIFTILYDHKLPESNAGQFYHPPMHQLMSAAYLYVVSFINSDITFLAESLQVLTTIYSMLIIYFSYKIFGELHIKNKYKLLGLLIVAFHPYFILLSGSINNDILCLLLMIISLYYLIKWNKDNNPKNTTLLAVFTGLSVMTKTSGALLAIPIGYVFILKYCRELRKNRNNKDKINKVFKKYLWSYIYFGSVSLPIGLWYNFRNLIKFNQPIIYVMDIHNADLYVGNYSFFERFLSINFTELFQLYCNPWVDYNIPIYLLKCSLFGEYTFLRKILLYYTSLLFNLAIFVLMIISIVYLFKTIKNKRNIIWKVAYLLVTIFNVLSYVKMNVALPYGCTMDFRYMILTVFTLAVFISLFNQEIKNVKLKEISYCISLVIIMGLMITSNILMLCA